MEVRGLAVTTFVFHQRFNAVGKPPVLAGGTDFPRVPLFSLPPLPAGLSQPAGKMLSSGVLT